MVDVLGLSIFLIGIGLIVFELSMPGYYIGVAGTTLVILGLVQMGWPQFLFSIWSPFTVVVVAVAALAASVQLYKKIGPPDTKPSTMSSDGLIGEQGQVLVEVIPHATTGKVKISGIIWSAESAEPIAIGRRVEVTRVEGVHVVVRPVAHAVIPAQPPNPDPVPEGDPVGRV